MIIRIPAFLLFMILAMFSYCQEIVIVDFTTKKPISDVLVTCSSSDQVFISNENGIVKLSEILCDSLITNHLSYEIGYFDLREIENHVWELIPKELLTEEVVISASKWKQNRREVSNKIDRIRRSDIFVKNAQTSADLLNGSGGVYVQKSQQGGGSPMIRGFSANRLLYVVDGVRMNTAIFRSGNVHNVISLDPFEMESVEVSFGPGSVIYGSDAVGGVMSFKTLTPRLSISDKVDFSGTVLSRYSSANKENTFHADLNLGFNKWAWVSSVTRYDFGHLRMGSNGNDQFLREYYVDYIDNQDTIIKNDDPRIQLPTAYSQWNMTHKLRYRPSELIDINFAFHFSETSSFGRYDRHLREQNGMPRYGEWSYGPQRWHMLRGGIVYHSPNYLWDDASINLAYQRFEESRITRNFQTVDRNARIEDIDAYSANIDFTKTINGGRRFYYGIEAIYNVVKSQGVGQNILTGTEFNISPRYPNADWYSYAAYFSLQQNFGQNWVVNSGIRFNTFQQSAKFDNQFFDLPFDRIRLRNSAISFTAGLVYNREDSYSVKLNLANGFRAPNVDDTGKIFDSEPGSVVVPNDNLRAEKVYNLDVGVDLVSIKNTVISLGMYYTYLDDAMVRRNFRLNGMDSIIYNGELSQVQAIQNASFAEILGGYFSVKWTFLENFELLTKVNYQEGTEELANGGRSAARHASPTFGSNQISYVNNGWRLSIIHSYNGGMRYEDLPVSERAKEEIYALDLTRRPYLESWHVFNFNSIYKYDEKWIFKGAIENIFDKRYRTYSSGIASPGRNLVLSIIYKIK